MIHTLLFHHVFHDDVSSYSAVHTIKKIDIEIHIHCINVQNIKAAQATIKMFVLCLRYDQRTMSAKAFLQWEAIQDMVFGRCCFFACSIKPCLVLKPRRLRYIT